VQAQIKVVQEFIYPSEYTEPQVSGGGGINGGNAAITPTVPSSFKTREVGVIMNVTPTVGSDNYTINLALTPEVSEFLGFLDYSPGNVTSGGNGTNSTSVPYKIQQPLFSTRSLATSVVIWDGQTVVLGGLIKENIQKIDDKVPFLGDIPIVGRLFRSKSTNRSKQNLLIFVTARLVDPAGNPLHKDIGRTSR
jgi:general secretion pathway protein D